ncbi:MAG: DUF4389 domain-containing protein [Betaproteobacteria bacterium]|nr:DUF4389 domain-containing protein [Betaproteobacteria bacterium]MDE2002343.1 DUF4389 domain-containing protein [Betaproteobacteria bacterium]MDE2209589.1 DUF4389 domain-containing protein [Betaproteobacteria bacterium]MDE2360691.1 DUF4389 domain-containing protein [Betaproteobacteria bacterium]
MADTLGPAAPYPVAYDVAPQLHGRNRLTVLFRLFLAIPQLILVGGPGLVLGGGLAWRFPANGDWTWGVHWGGGGVLGAVAFVMAIIAWFAILVANTHPRGLWDFACFYMSWRARAIAYIALLRDEYPPFGDGAYPAHFAVSHPDGPRNKWSVALRIVYVIPQAIVLFFLGIAWCITAVIAWFAILFTGSYPEPLYRFAVGYLRWSLRVESYLLLLRDEYPPFSFEA